MTERKPTPFASHAQQLVDLGYSVVPIRPGEKRPVGAAWQTAYLRQDEILAQVKEYATYGVGILTRGLAAIDLDIYDKKLSREMRAYVLSALGVEEAPTRVGMVPKMLILCSRAEGEMPKMASSYWRDAEGVMHRIEVLGDGQQFVAYGIHADTQRPYIWTQQSISDFSVSILDLPVVTTEILQDILAKFDELAEQSNWERISNASTGVASGEVPWPVSGLTLDMAEDALRYYPNADLHYDEWLSVGMALHQQFAGYQEAFDIWDQWSQGSSKCRSTQVNWKHWQSFTEDRPGGLTLRRYLNYAERNGWQRPSSVEGAPASVDDFDEISLPQPEPSNAPEAPEAKAPLRSAPWTIGLDFEPNRIPKRDWVLPGVLMRGHVTGLAGPPGVSKSVFELSRAVSICTGRELLDEQVIVKGNVLLVNNEDDTEELKRRIAGIQIVHGIPNTELYDRLYIWSGYGEPIRFAEKRDKYSKLDRTKGVPKLIEWMKDKKIVALFVDPLISTALGAEENDNNDMDALVSIWKGIAAEAQVAVSLTHHTRKTQGDSEGHAGDAQAFRGGGAFIGAVRLAHTLARMSKETENKLGLEPNEARRMVRQDNAKSNYHLPDAEAAWFRLQSVQLPSGDSVGVPIPVDNEEMERLSVADKDAAYADADLYLRRTRIVNLFMREVTEEAPLTFNASLNAIAERWMSEVDCSKRTAGEQIKRLVPDGGPDAAVTVAVGNHLYEMWRRALGAKSNRYEVSIRRVGATESDSWED